MYFNYLDGIHCEDNEGILKLMQEEKEKIMEEEKEMYDEALERLRFTIDYDELLEENLEDMREEVKEEVREEVREEIREKVTESVTKEKTLKLFKKFYPNEDTNFLNHLSLKQYTQIFDSLINDESINQIKALCL